jgi:hypothetical protein
MVVALQARPGLLAVLAEGVAEERAGRFQRAVRYTLERDRGTPMSSLLRAVRAGCAELERLALHRHELTGFGTTALYLDSARGLQAHFTQLAPSQAYVLDSGELRLLPPEQMARAAHVASAAGRRWEVELEPFRTALRPGATILLCTSSLAGELSPSRIEDLLRLPLPQAARELAHPGRRRGGTRGALDAILLRLAEAEPAPRVRLHAVTGSKASATFKVQRLQEESGRVPGWLGESLRRGPVSGRRVTPMAMGEEVGGGRRVPIEAWGLRRRRRPPVPLPGPLWGAVEALLAPADTLIPERKGRWRRVLLAGLAALVVGAGLWSLQRHRADLAAGPAADATVGVVAPAPPAISGATLLLAQEPFESLAVVARAGEPAQVYVLDRARQIVLPGSAGAPAAVLGGDQPASGPDGTGAGWLAVRDGDVLWLDGNRTLQVVSSVAGRGRLVPLRGTAAWQRPVAIAVYAGNLYVLDAGGSGSPGQIWRHPGTAGGGFDGEPVAWVPPGAGVSLAEARGFAIDGSIWVAAGDQGILRLSAGRRQPFQPSGLDAPLLSAGAIYTEAGFRSVYVVDAAARRLVQLSKDGAFERQVTEVFPIGEHPRGLWVEEGSSRAVILTDRRLQEVSFS